MPPGFQVDAPITGVTKPTAIEFAADGRVFVAERSGRVLVFDGVLDTAPRVFADFQVRVHAFHDRGLLGLALDPAFPEEPYVYVSYTRDALVGGPDPPPALHDDGCSVDETSGASACVVSGRIARLEMDPATGLAKLGAGGLPLETWAVTNWCQQFVSHSIGDLEFDASGSLYAGGGDGASFMLADYGQLGENVCGDPPSEGGALRSQDLGSATDVTGYDGTIIRIDPDTGAARSDNPLFAGSDVDARRIVAFGLRNPFRFEFRPGTSDLYIQDTGWSTYEEIDRIPPGSTAVPNFGWPCYEGNHTAPAYDVLDLPLCEALYPSSPPNPQAPFFEYQQYLPLYPGDTCQLARGASGSGISFHQGDHFPASYLGAMFFANASAGCIWSMLPGAGGVPDPASVQIFATADEQGEFTPVDIVEGPDGALYLPNFFSDEIVRIRSFTETPRRPPGSTHPRAGAPPPSPSISMRAAPAMPTATRSATSGTSTAMASTTTPPASSRRSSTSMRTRRTSTPVSASAIPTGSRTRRGSGSTPATAPRSRRSGRPPPVRPGQSATRSRSPARPPTPTRAPWVRNASTGRSRSSTARRYATATPCSTWRTPAAAPSPRPVTSRAPT